jgi:hypothetical protein
MFFKEMKIEKKKRFKFNFEAPKVSSSRIIAPSSGNDVLLDELSSLINTVERNEDDYFDFDALTATPLRGKKNAQINKSPKSISGGRTTTTKRTPDFDFFEPESDFQRPTKKQNFGQQQNIRPQPQSQPPPPRLPPPQQQPKLSRQQQQDQQLQQIRSFIDEQHRQYKQVEIVLNFFFFVTHKGLK